MNGVTEYAQALRAIGQALETLRVQKFEMQPIGEDFLVRGDISTSGSLELDHPDASGRLRRTIWGDAPREYTQGVEREAAAVVSAVELLYGSADVERLETAGRSRRTDSHGTPEPSSLSQTLRCIGGYLGQKRAHLRKLSREGDAISVEYDTSLGTSVKEVFEPDNLYNLWVRMYLQRAERATR